MKTPTFLCPLSRSLVSFTGGVCSRVLMVQFGFGFGLVSPLSSARLPHAAAVGPCRGRLRGTVPSPSTSGCPGQLQRATRHCPVEGLRVAGAHPGAAARRPRGAVRYGHERARGGGVTQGRSHRPLPRLRKGRVGAQPCSGLVRNRASTGGRGRESSSAGRRSSRPQGTVPWGG